MIWQVLQPVRNIISEQVHKQTRSKVFKGLARFIAFWNDCPNNFDQFLGSQIFDELTHLKIYFSNSFKRVKSFIKMFFIYVFFVLEFDPRV